MANIPLFRGVANRTGCSLNTVKVLKVLREGWPSGMANIPLFRGVADRTGCSLPHPCPLISGRGAAKAWGIFPSLEGWPTGRGVRSLTHALSQRERGGRSMANIPLFRGVADRTGCSMATP